MTHPFIEHLLKDHKKQRDLNAKLVAAKTKEEKKQYRKALYDALYPHIEGEDASIFKFLYEKSGKYQEDALEAMQEHHLDRILLDELMSLDLDDEVLLAKSKVLEEVNGHHLDEEEKTHFPNLESAASDDELDALFERYEKAEEQFKKQ
jgi:hemerythrin-like domain-containing protein